MALKLHTIKSIALAASIIIVLNLFINIGVRTFYPSPKHNDFCPEGKVSRAYNDQDTCIEAGGQWIEDVRLRRFPREVEAPIPAPVRVVEDAEEISGYCDPSFSCRKEYRAARDVYNRNVFVILVIAGLVVLGVGLRIVAAAAVSSGLVLGGVLSFIIGTIRYWSGMHDYLRFIILGIALAVLIWVGYRKLQK